MKTFVLIAALALVLPEVASARSKSHHGHRHHGGHSHSSHRHHGHSGHRHYGGSRFFFNSRPSYYGSYYSRPYYGYSSPYYGYSSPYYGYSSYGYGYPSYYRTSPSLSFVYSSSSPRYYETSRSYRSTADSLEVDVQIELKRRGYYRGPIDGDIGPGSRNAIRAYQADRRLAVTGRIDSALLRSLGI